MKALHLGALWAFAFAQPLFDLLGGQAQFFVARGSTAADIVIFAVAFTVVPPALMALAVWLLGRVRPALGEALQIALVGVLVAAIALPPAGDLLGGSAYSVALAALVGAGAAALYARAAAVRAFASVLTPAPLLFLALFLAASPVSELVLPADGPEAVAVAARSDTPVVMVVFDELATTSLVDTRGRIDAERFPAFASVAADATWYRDATTVAGRTTEAVPALLTGRRPRDNELPTARYHPRSLFTLLGRSHRLEVVEPITDVCPRELCSERRPGIASRLRALGSDLRVVSAHLLLPDDLRDGLPPIDRTWQGFAGDSAEAPTATVQQREKLKDSVGRALLDAEPTQRFAQIAGAIEDGGDRPPLLFLHTTLPHAHWEYLPDGRRYALPDPAIPGLVDGEWTAAQWLADQGFQRHLVQTQYADRLLGGLLARLRATGLYDRALVVVTADHGVSFLAGDSRRKPTQSNLGGIAGVPLFIKAPGQQEPRVQGGAVRMIDVLPTMAQMLGIELAGAVDGEPAAERGADPATEIVLPDSYLGGTTGTFGAFLEQRDARLRHQRAIATDDLYAIGPRPDLMGRRLGALPASRGRVRLADPDAYRAVRPDSASLPAFVTGEIAGLPAGTPLAVTVNGRIEATTRVDATGDEPRFGALVGPSSLRPGANRIGVLEIGPGGLRIVRP